MKKRHALAISLLLGLAVLAGGYAAVKTADAGEPATVSTGTPAASAAQAGTVNANVQAALDRYEAELDAAIANVRGMRLASPPVESAAVPVATTSDPVPDDDQYENERNDEYGDSHASGDEYEGEDD